MMRVGFAASESLAAVQPFYSAYASKSATQKALDAAMAGTYGYSDWFIVGFGGLTDEESIMEGAEFFARDQVTGCEGVDYGYTLLDPIELEPVRDYVGDALRDVARLLHMPLASVRILFDSWRDVVQIESDKDAAREFARWHEDKSRYCYGR